MSLGWFDCTLTTSLLKGKQGVQHIKPSRTFSNHIVTEIARFREFFNMSSEWFNSTEPSLTTSLQGKQGVQDAYTQVQV